ncbi:MULTISPECIES: FAD-binding oxidoreductase [unclassified Ensifer]|uniref:NAD(P)/FAD-dependent oxidoreductase n=1 Tax=unclassified Ensifer TaxID=2633371 RepID=UPI000AA89641|nr:MULTISPECIES: FAD-binding oxidoreductase [unclassified Ensifer]
MAMRSGSSSPKVIVIGGGIAGLSVAAAVQEWASVVLIEREAHLGYHASGRSAALFAETYGNTVVRALSIASRPAIVDGGFAEHVRGALHFGGCDDDAMVDELAQKYQALVPSVRRLSADEVSVLIPVIRADTTCGGVYEPGALDIDTGKMVHAAAAALKALGGTVISGEEVLQISRISGRFQVVTSAGSYEGDMVVNAAGAWVDVIAERAGLAGLGFSPKRRTAFMFDPPAGLDARTWPLAVDLHERFYFKPDAGKLSARWRTKRIHRPATPTLKISTSPSPSTGSSRQPSFVLAGRKGHGPDCAPSRRTARPSSASIRACRAFSGSVAKAVMASRSR